jgi:hypothetical protein
MEHNAVSDGSEDRKYFTIVPRVVWAKCRNPYDLALWIVVKDISGQSGECYLSTSDLAELAMMSRTQAHRSREYLVQSGLLTGEKRKDPGYPISVWHLRVPDLWKENVEWAETHIKIADRLRWKSVVSTRN